jgi:hypothetical protein
MVNLDNFKSIPPRFFTYVTLNHDLFNLQRCYNIKGFMGSLRKIWPTTMAFMKPSNKMLVGSIATIVSLRFWQLRVFGC